MGFLRAVRRLGDPPFRNGLFCLHIQQTFGSESVSAKLTFQFSRMETRSSQFTSGRFLAFNTNLRLLVVLSKMSDD